MTTKTLSFIVCFGLALILTTDMASAQFGGMRSSRFPQNNPYALSPWLEMERVSSSQLDSYNQYVRPRLEMERLLSAQLREMNSQMDRQKMMQKDISQLRNTRQGTSMGYQFQTEASPTGIGGGYGNYLHYYKK